REQVADRGELTLKEGRGLSMSVGVRRSEELREDEPREDRVLPRDPEARGRDPSQRERQVPVVVDRRLDRGILPLLLRGEEGPEEAPLAPEVVIEGRLCDPRRHHDLLDPCAVIASLREKLKRASKDL